MEFDEILYKKIKKITNWRKFYKFKEKLLNFMKIVWKNLISEKLKTFFLDLNKNIKITWNFTLKIIKIVKIEGTFYKFKPKLIKYNKIWLKTLLKPPILINNI